MDVGMLKDWFARMHSVGAAQRGVTRPGYSDEEDAMHALLRTFAAELGLTATEDSFGNTFISFPDAKSEGRVLIGSHLDSVPEGGRYDGVAGVLAGLLAMAEFKAEARSLPLETVAFRCEESSAFGLATVGSALFAGTVDPETLHIAKNADGKSLYDAMKEKGYTPDDSSVPSDIRAYLELHIEQGRVLEASGKKLGIVTAIAAPVRFRIFFEGRRDHSGATPMGMRKDSLCAAGEALLAVERCGEAESGFSTVATVGIIRNEPNALNVIPGCTSLGVDVRGIDAESVRRAAEAIRKEVAEIGRRRGVRFRFEEISSSMPVMMDPSVVEGLRSSAERLGADFMTMPSGAGHDAMKIAPYAPAGMLFIPCRDGVSHSPEEHAEIDDVFLGARLLHDYLNTYWKENDR